MEAQQAFEAAIAQGRLSDNPADDNYAGNYMYMGTSPRAEDMPALFKHVDTRQYLN